MAVRAELRIGVTDPVNLRPCAFIATFGMRGSGKSCFMSHLIQCYHRRGIHRFIVFCAKEPMKIEWRRVLPALYIHGPDHELLERILDDQEKRVSPIRLRHELREAERARRDPDNYQPKEFVCPVKYRLVIALEDLGTDGHFAQSRLMKDIGALARHLGIELFGNYQTITQLHKQCRKQLDYVALTHVDTKEDWDTIFRQFGGGGVMVTQPVFQTTVSTILKTLGQVVWIDMGRAASNDITKRIRAVIVPFPPVRKAVGSRKYGRFHKEHYVPASEEVRIVREERGRLDRRMGTTGPAPSTLSLIDRLDDKALEQLRGRSFVHPDGLCIRLMPEAVPLIHDK